MNKNEAPWGGLEELVEEIIAAELAELGEESRSQEEIELLATLVEIDRLDHRCFTTRH